MKKERKDKLPIIIIFLIITAATVLSPGIPEANLSGSIEYSYNTFVLKSTSTRSRTNDFQQSYRINKDGFLLSNKNIGNFSLGFGYMNLKSKSAALSGNSYEHTKNSSDSYNYTASSSLFPTTFSPLTLQLSRYITELDKTLNVEARGESFAAKTETDSYNATWRLISRRRLPTMTSSFRLVKTKSENENDKRRERRRKAKFDVTKSGLRTMYRINYDYEDFLDRERGDRTESHATSMSFNRQLSRRMSFNGSGGYNLTESSDSFNIASSLFMRHTRKLNSNYSYNFAKKDSKALNAETSVSNRLAARVRYIPTSKLSTNANYSYTNSVPNITNNNTISLGGSYRITERWNTNASSAFNLIRGGNKDSRSESYSASTNYSRPFKYAQISPSYTFSFSTRTADSEEGKSTGTNTSHSLGFGTASRSFKVVSVSSNLRLSKTDSSSDSSSESSSENRDSRSATEGMSASLGMNSNYFKYVSINTSGSYRNLLSTGIRNETINSGVTLDFSIFNRSVLTLGYNFSRFMSSSQDAASEVQSFSANSSAPFVYSKRITRHLTFNLTAKYNRNYISKSDTKTEVISVGPKITYNIGKLLFTFDFRFNETKTKSQGNKTYSGYYNMILKGSRRF